MRARRLFGSCFCKAAACCSASFRSASRAGGILRLVGLKQFRPNNAVLGGREIGTGLEGVLILPDGLFIPLPRREEVGQQHLGFRVGLPPLR